jgi:hypothetical protein
MGIWGVKAALNQIKFQDEGAKRQIEAERLFRCVDHLEKQVDIFSSSVYLETRKSLASKRLLEDSLASLDIDDPPEEAYEILNFFEHLAFLVERKHLIEYDVWHSFWYWAEAYYCDFEALIRAELNDDPTAFCDFVKLMEKLKAVQKAEGGSTSKWESDELVEFYRLEKGANKKIGTQNKEQIVKRSKLKNKILKIETK